MFFHRHVENVQTNHPPPPGKKNRHMLLLFALIDLTVYLRYAKFLLLCQLIILLRHGPPNLSWIMFPPSFPAPGPPQKKAAWMTILWRDIQQKKKTEVRLMEEVRRLPVDMVNIPVFTGFFLHPRWLFGISEPSKVFHPEKGRMHRDCFLFILKKVTYTAVIYDTNPNFMHEHKANPSKLP